MVSTLRKSIPWQQALFCFMTSEPSDVLCNVLLNECMNMIDTVVYKLRFLPLRNHIEGNTYSINNYNNKLDICYSQRARGWDGKWYILRELKSWRWWIQDTVQYPNLIKMMVHKSIPLEELFLRCLTTCAFALNLKNKLFKFQTIIFPSLIIWWGNLPV